MKKNINKILSGILLGASIMTTSNIVYAAKSHTRAVGQRRIVETYNETIPVIGTIEANDNTLEKRNTSCGVNNCSKFRGKGKVSTWLED